MPRADRHGGGDRPRGPGRISRLMLAWAVSLAALVGGVHPVDAIADEAPLVAADPELEARTLAIASELRCLVCQNQTIAESHAELAVDLRNQVREMLRQGRDERDVLEYMTQRYGDFVLYRPPLKGSTALLWFGPILLLVVGLVVLVTILRRRTALPADRFEPDPDDLTDVGESPPEAAPGRATPEVREPR